MGFDLKEILNTFVVLFAIINITGSIPVIINLKQRKGKIKSEEVSFVSFLTLTFDICIFRNGSSSNSDQKI